MIKRIPNLCNYSLDTENRLSSQISHSNNPLVKLSLTLVSEEKLRRKMAAQMKCLPMSSFVRWGHRPCPNPGTNCFAELIKHNFHRKSWRTNQIERITVIITLIYLAFYRSLWTILKKHHHIPSCFSWQLLKVGNEYVNSLSISILQGFQTNQPQAKELDSFSDLLLIQWYIHSDDLSSQISTTLRKISGDEQIS